MDKQSLKKIIILSILFFLGGLNIYAAPPPVSENVSVSAKVGEEIIITPGGGGTHGGIILPKTAVTFSGFAYPFASVSLLRAGHLEKIVQADNQGDFNITIIENDNSSTLYSLFAEDISGTRSVLLNYRINVQVGYITQVSGIRFAPTILTDKSQVRAGDYLTVYGYALPQKEMQITVSSTPKKIFSLTSSTSGAYKIVLPLTTISKGTYYLFINYKNDTRRSQLIWFTIAGKNIFNTTNAKIILPNSDFTQNIHNIFAGAISPGTNGTNPKNSFIITALLIIVLLSLLFIFILLWRRRDRSNETNKE